MREATPADDSRAGGDPSHRASGDEIVLDAVIVGAGFAGLYQLYRLRELGLDAIVVEAGNGVGGTWFWNRYPGARCDIESRYYSYSFSPELDQDWTWTQKYAAQPEILSYLNHVADRFDLRRDIRLGTRVTSANYDETTMRWSVNIHTGQVFVARFLIMATGCLSVSKMPEVSGIERFHGSTYHTGHWPHEGVDFTGLRVGVIGTGSSGIQSIPIIAEQASDLTVFQRTPAFSLAAGNRPIQATEVQQIKAGYPEWRRMQRESNGGVPARAPSRSALDVTAEERVATYQLRWEEGTLFGIISAYNDLVIDRTANETAAEFIRSKISATVRDPTVADTLSPGSYPFGTKRACLDTAYYETYNKAQVHLVDLRKTPLVEITEAGIRTTEREFELDAIVFATGFDAMTGALTALDIRGKGGVALKDRWNDGPRTYLGIAISGFPNLFTITGPLSPSVLTNMVVSIEQHVEWISACIAQLRENGVAAIEATGEAQDAWAAHVAEIASYTLYPTADSWYMGANVPGKPRLFMAYIGGVAAYSQKCDEVAARGYEGFTLTPASPTIQDDAASK